MAEDIPIWQNTLQLSQRSRCHFKVFFLIDLVKGGPKWAVTVLATLQPSSEGGLERPLPSLIQPILGQLDSFQISIPK